MNRKSLRNKYHTLFRHNDSLIWLANHLGSHAVFAETRAAQVSKLLDHLQSVKDRKETCNIGG